jgi:hypothetical protein
MQHQQVCIAAYQNIGLGCQRQCQKIVVFGIAAERSDGRQVSKFNCEEKGTPPYCRYKRVARIPITITVELSAIQNLLQLGKCLYARAQVKGFQCFR